MIRCRNDEFQGLQAEGSSSVRLSRISNSSMDCFTQGAGYKRKNKEAENRAEKIKGTNYGFAVEMKESRVHQERRHGARDLPSRLCQTT
jgi:hypothetical protein